MSDTTRTAPRHLAALTATSTRSWRLHVVRSADPTQVGAILPLPAGVTVLGRAPSARRRWAFGDPQLSRDHLRVEVRGARDSVLLEDLDSRNGSWAGGQPLERARVGDGAVLRFGAEVAVLESDPVAHEEFAEPSTAVPGRSWRARGVRSAIADAARDARPALVIGPTGSGKEHVAEAVHVRSGRPGPLVRMNVAAVPTNLFESELFGHVRGAFSGASGSRVGRFEEADGGTLVLDEIGDLPLALQPKLLRVLEETCVRPVGGEVDRPVDVRVVASTHVDLAQAVAQERFRRDLFTRLSGHVVRLPTLTERKCDLLALADRVCPVPGGGWAAMLSADAVEGMLLYSWPGNLRELDAALRYGLSRAEADEVDLSALPATIVAGVREAVRGAGPTASHALRHGTKSGPGPDQLRAVLSECRGNVGEVARHFGVARRQVYRWLRYAEIDAEELARLREGP